MFVKKPALALAMLLFLCRLIPGLSETVENNQILWSIYKALIGATLFLQKQIPWDQSENWVFLSLHFTVLYANLWGLFFITRQLTRPLKWALWIIFLIFGFIIYSH